MQITHIESSNTLVVSDFNLQSEIPRLLELMSRLDTEYDMSITFIDSVFEGYREGEIMLDIIGRQLETLGVCNNVYLTLQGKTSAAMIALCAFADRPRIGHIYGITQSISTFLEPNTPILKAAMERLGITEIGTSGYMHQSPGQYEIDGIVAKVSAFENNTNYFED